MRTSLTPTVLTGLFLGLILPGATTAEVILRPHDPQAAERPLEAKTDVPGLLGPKVDEPSDILFVPFYEVDTTSGSGTTTLFGVRNTSSGSVDLDVRYLSPGADILRQDLVVLDPRETLTVNVRDVAGLPADFDGFARGYVGILVDSMEPMPDNLVGDYLQVDVANNFATGERMVSFGDVCDEQEIRFLDFGAGTELRFLVNFPQGNDPMVDPPTMTVRPFGEDGAAFPATDVFTNDNAFSLPSSAFTGVRFGTLVIDFSNASGGLVYAEYSAEGRFSTGLNGACTVP